MYGKKVKLRFLFLTLVLVSVILSIFLILQSLKDNVIYFQSPSEIKSLIELNEKKISNEKRANAAVITLNGISIDTCIEVFDKILIDAG